MDHHLGLRVAFGVTVARDVVPRLEDDHVVTILGDLAGDHRAREPGPGNAEPHRPASDRSSGSRRGEI
jgi:hypothetical protein